MIKLTAIGNLGKDAIINQVNGKQVINFSIAHTEKFTSNGESKEKTTWVECAYWSESKVGAYLLKGTQVYVEGQPEARSYPKTDGSTGVSLTVRVFNIQLLGSKQGGSAPSEQSGEYDKETLMSPAATARVAQTATQSADDSLPF